MATSSNDAIIAIVDRSGGILGVRTESDAEAMYPGREADLVFAIDGAVAKARTAAFFSNEEAPAPDALRADQFMVAGVRLPYQNFNRDPRG
ncbi:MAG TPA: hypothetical protein VM260_14750 [Pirellula sp.]|nr:hypothetical protein [Pirellula sp.]